MRSDQKRDIILWTKSVLHGGVPKTSNPLQQGLSRAGINTALLCACRIYRADARVVMTVTACMRCRLLTRYVYKRERGIVRKRHENPAQLI